MSLKVPDVNDTIVVIEYNFGFVVHAEKAGMETGGGCHPTGQACPEEGVGLQLINGVEGVCARV